MEDIVLSMYNKYIIIVEEDMIVLNQIISFHKEEFMITTDTNKLDFKKVYNLLSKTYWASSRSKDVMVKSFKNSLCFSLFYKDEQIGLLRVVSDFTTFSYICDFIIDEDYRQKGLGSWCMDCVFKYPDLEDVKRWCLLTKDAHEFYKQFGFTALSKPEIYMELIN